MQYGGSRVIYVSAQSLLATDFNIGKVARLELVDQSLVAVLTLLLMRRQIVAINMSEDRIARQI